MSKIINLKPNKLLHFLNPKKRQYRAVFATLTVLLISLAGYFTYNVLFTQAEEITYYFNSYSVGKAWDTGPENMVDNNTGVYASTDVDEQVQFLDDNTSDGTHLGAITKVEVRVYAYRSAGTCNTAAARRASPALALVSSAAAHTPDEPDECPDTGQQHERRGDAEHYQLPLRFAVVVDIHYCAEVRLVVRHEERPHDGASGGIDPVERTRCRAGVGRTHI